LSDNLAKELEETKVTATLPQRATKTTHLTQVFPEDLGAMLARQELKMKALNQKQ